MKIFKILSTNLIHILGSIIFMILSLSMMKITGLIDGLTWELILLKSTWSSPMYYHIFNVPFFVYLILLYCIVDVFMYKFTNIKFTNVLLVETIPVIIIFIRWGNKNDDWLWYVILISLIATQIIRYYLVGKAYNLRT